MQAKKIYPNPTYKIQKIADKFTSGGFNIKVLFLPVAHRELNPIEMFWSKLKRNIAATNMSYRLSEVELRARQEVESMTAAEFSKYVNHVIREEEKFKELSTE